MLNKSRVFRGNWGKLIIDGHTFSNVKGVEWKLKQNTEKIPQVGSTSEAEIPTSKEGTGNIKLTKTDSYMVRLILSYIREGKAQNFTIITSQASDRDCKNEEKIRLTGVSFSEVGGAWEAGKVSEEGYDFTYEDVEPISWAEDDK